MNQDLEKIFTGLVKPHCVKLIQNPTIYNVLCLKEALRKENLPMKTLQSFQEYLIFPVMVIMRLKERSDNLLIESVKCLEYVLKSTEVKSEAIFIDIVQHLFLLISSPHLKIEGTLDGSEELKVSISSCFKSLLENSNQSVLETVTGDKFLPILGHSIFVLLKLSENEANRSLQILAFQCISCLSTIPSNDRPELRTKFGSTFAFFIPGISIAVSNVLTVDTKQGHKVIQEALQTWSNVLTLAMNDEDISGQKFVNTKDRRIEKNSSLKAIVRDAQWLEDTTEKLSTLIQKVCSCLVGHPNYHVRSSLLTWAETLLSKSLISLKKCLINLVEVVLILCNDEYECVSHKAVEALSLLSDKLEKNMEKSLVELLEEQIYCLTTRLPRMIRTGSDEQKLVSLQLLSGYIKLLGPNIDKFICLTSHSERFFKCLIHLVEFDLSDLSITLKRPVTTTNYSPLKNINSYIWRKNFKHFSNDKIFNVLKSIFRSLASKADILVVVELLLDFSRALSYKKQCILFLNIIANFLHDHHDITRLLLMEYIGDDLWKSNEPDNFSNTQIVTLSAGDDKNLEIYKSRIVLEVLLLEGISNFSKALKQDFRIHLMDCLYTILEKTSSECLAISNAAYTTLLATSKSCAYNTVSDMIKDNSVYLIDVVSKKLRQTDFNSDVPQVLTVVLQNSSPGILLIFKDTFEEMLFALDYNQSSRKVYLETIYVLVNAIHNWNSTSKEKENKPADSVKTCVNSSLHLKSEKIQKYINDHHEKTLELKMTMEEQISEDKELTAEDFSSNNEEESSDKEDTQDPPIYLTVLTETMKRCSHMMSSKEPQTRLLVLEIIMKITQILSNRENDLLPLVHQIWPAFVERFYDQKLFVVAKAFECLVNFSDICGDFIKQRVMKTIWLKLIAFVGSQARISIKAKFASYKFTQEFKLQLFVLQKLGKLVTKLSVLEEEFTKICNACMAYLDFRQPQILQTEGVELFKIFVEYDADTVWLLTSRAYSNSKYLSHENKKFPQIFFKYEEDNNRFKENISIINDYLESYSASDSV